MFTWHWAKSTTIQTVLHRNAGNNQIKKDSKSISCLQMPHFFEIAKLWRAHESQKRTKPQETNTILALGYAQQLSQTLSDNVEAKATGSADAADECELALFVESFAALSSQLCANG